MELCQNVNGFSWTVVNIQKEMRTFSLRNAFFNRNRQN